MKILVYAEQRDGKLKQATFETLAVARELGADGVDVVCVGDVDVDWQGYGISKVYRIGGQDVYNPITYAACVQAAIAASSPTLLLGIASPLGRDLFARLAARLDCGIVTDAVKVWQDGEFLQATKPMYAGKCLATIRLLSEFSIVALRPNVIAPLAKGDASTDDTVEETLQVELPATELKTKEFRQGNSEKPDLTEAALIISGGRALANADNFKILDACADVIGATVGASRAAVDSGYAPHDMQVGQTGKIGNPNLYIA
ncbi:MAG: electron transfer flavoprotein subunit alpha/FixB family protein, partial [Pseudomonadota bacterium]|nr:electron transfer flavoprotein subunit alpha/FixB family protein [Pseudomonadota bacterium]